MKSWQMICSRIWAGTFGAIPWCGQMMKRVLILIFINRAKKKYVAATEYFDMKRFLK
ncbi:MAG: hypothetical protein HQL21_02205 [Candidatus Omnitrophica bacterium]|nr:hypothetical protein [Candidatus Omnitrophota bacterium]